MWIGFMKHTQCMFNMLQVLSVARYAQIQDLNADDLTNVILPVLHIREKQKKKRREKNSQI